MSLIDIAAGVGIAAIGVFGSMAVFGAVVVTVDIHHDVHEQTALLREIRDNTRTPVAVEVSGFSPEAQQVFNQAVKAKGRK